MSNIDQQIQNFETAFQQTKIQATSPTQNEVKADQNIFKQNDKNFILTNIKHYFKLTFCP